MNLCFLTMHNQQIFTLMSFPTCNTKRRDSDRCHRKWPIYSLRINQRVTSCEDLGRTSGESIVLQRSEIPFHSIIISQGESSGGYSDFQWCRPYSECLMIIRFFPIHSLRIQLVFLLFFSKRKYCTQCNIFDTQFGLSYKLNDLRWYSQPINLSPLLRVLPSCLTSNFYEDINVLGTKNMYLTG